MDLKLILSILAALGIAAGILLAVCLLAISNLDWDAEEDGCGYRADRPWRLIKQYVKLAREAAAPKLPAVLDLKKAYPYLALHYGWLGILSGLTVSSVKKHVYYKKRERIRAAAIETRNMLRGEIDLLDEMYATKLSNRAQALSQVADQGADEFALRLKKAKES